MVRIGDVHCHECGDAFEPEGLPSFDGPNFCSDRCVELFDLGEIYDQARYGAAEVF